VKLPRSASYIYNNLCQFNDIAGNISYYAVINGFEVWIIKHSDPEQLSNKDQREPTVQLRKVPYDKLDRVSCAKWCEFNAATTFVMGTESGRLHVYDFEAKKVLHSLDVSAATSGDGAAAKLRHSLPSPTINCVESDGAQSLFVGLSSGALLSFAIDDKGLSRRTLIFQCDGQEAINCIERARITKQNMNKSNKIYFGCDDGAVIQYDLYTQCTDELIGKSNATKIYDEEKMGGGPQGDRKPVDDTKYANNCGACLCMAAGDEFVVAGYSSGHIKIVQKSELSFVIKMVAVHRRMVTAVAVLEGMGLIATASEDGYFHAMRNTTTSLDVVRSGQFENGILVGIQFVKSKHFSRYEQKARERMVLVTAYDRNRVAFV